MVDHRNSFFAAEFYRLEIRLAWRGDPSRFLELLGDLIVTVREAVKGANPRVSLFGECVHLLWAQGNAEAAIQIEKLGNKVIQMHDVDILCGYSVGSGMHSDTFQRICAEHSAVYSQ